MFSFSSTAKSPRFEFSYTVLDATGMHEIYFTDQVSRSYSNWTVHQLPRLHVITGMFLWVVVTQTKMFYWSTTLVPKLCSEELWSLCQQVILFYWSPCIEREGNRRKDTDSNVVLLFSSCKEHQELQDKCDINERRTEKFIVPRIYLHKTLQGLRGTANVTCKSLLRVRVSDSLNLTQRLACWNMSQMAIQCLHLVAVGKPNKCVTL